jgi:hypothetical protein
MVRDQAPARRNARRIARLGAALAFLAIGAGSALAADDALLARLAGEWIGNGTVKLNPKAAPEKIYCRIVGTLVGGTTIEQKGRCSVASNSGALATIITAHGGGRYRGTMKAPSLGTADLSGSASGGKLQLTATYLDGKTKEQRQANVTMNVADAAYRVITSGTGADSYVASDITFKKK